MSHGIDYKEVLNPSQLEAVMTIDGPVLVIAGAGSGKTRTLVYRVAYLVDSGISPEEILLLTFTRKASQQMLDRAAELSDTRCRFVSGGTFHSLAHKVLRNNAERIGFKNSFSILDRPDMEAIIHSLVPELHIPKGTNRFPKRATLANIISKCANTIQSVESLMMDEYSQFVEFISDINRLDVLYREYKTRNQLMDYDDLIINLSMLLERHEDLRRDIGRQFRYVMVDEYQDTNSIQSSIVKWIAHEHRNIMVVGDDSQSIYSFRGANYRNMFEFTDHFKEARLIKLEENYRSVQPILSFANTLMDHADEKFTKCLFTKRKDGEIPKVIDTKTAPEQALFICQCINDQVRKGRSLNDFAVLFRAGYQSFDLEAELTRQTIPYVKYGGFKFLESAHIKDFLSHLRVRINPEDEISWTRLLELIEHIGHAKSQSIVKWMRDNKIQPENLYLWPGSGKSATGIKLLSGLFEKLGSVEINPQKAVEITMEYYDPILKNSFDDFPRRRKELEMLAPMAARYDSLKNFLDDLVLEPPSSSTDLEMETRGETLTLSTIHSSKGLEWPVVFIIYLMEGRFPPPKAYETCGALEEERRLLYVAATRAKDQLIMCYPGQDPLSPWQSGGAYMGGVSSFVSELPDDIVSYESMGKYRMSKDMSENKNNFRQTDNMLKKEEAFQRKNKHINEFRKGDMVIHPAFGPGVVSKFFDDKIEVFFKNAGKKLLHLEYTTLEKI